MMSDDEYLRAVELCRRVVDAHDDRDAEGTVAGSFLGQLRNLFTAEVPTDET